MKKTKTKTEDKMENEKSEVTIEQIGKEIQSRLNKHFEQWAGALQFRFVMSNQAYRAKALKIDVGTLANQLEEMGFIKVLNTPSGQRFIFSGNCPWGMEEMQNWLQEQEIHKESQKEFKKQLKAQQA